MFSVIGIGKATGQEIKLLSNVSEEVAERFCEEWGWSYDDGKRAYWTEIREDER